MAEAKPSEDPEVVAYQDPLSPETIRAMAVTMGCDPDTEVWDGQKCVPKGSQTKE